MAKLAPLAFVTLLLGAGAYFHMQERRAVAGFVEVPGKIREITSRRVTQSDGDQYSTDVRALVEYRINGKRNEISSQFFGIPKWRSGQSVTVVVSPTSPNTGRIDRVDDIYPKSAGLTALGLLCLCVYWLGRLLGNRRRRPDN